MLSRALERPRAVLALGLLSGLPPLVWWLGWFPGLLSSDSMDQYRQAVTSDFAAFHPIAHTATLWLVTRFWESPGAVTLLQVALLAVLLALAAQRLSRLGVPRWAAVAAAWLVGIVPMVAVTTITVWKDVPFTLAFIWAFAELLGLAADRDAFWSSRAGPIRLGVALGVMWATRSNGFITVVALLVVLAVVERRRLRLLLGAVIPVVLVGLAVPSLLLVVLPVRPGGTEPAEVFIADVAAALTHAPETFDDGDLQLVSALASPVVWRQQYDCTDSTPLLFDPRFDVDPVRAEPWPYRRLVVETVVQAMPTVAGHRWCAADYLFLPISRTGSFLHYPPFAIPENDLGVSRSPLSDRVFAATLDVYQWAEAPSHRWLTWRPALVVVLGLVSWIAVAVRRSLRPLSIAGALYLIHLGNVAATTPAQEFRYAFPLYTVALLTVPLWWLVARPAQAGFAQGSRRSPLA